MYISNLEQEIYTGICWLYIYNDVQLLSNLFDIENATVSIKSHSIEAVNACSLFFFLNTAQFFFNTQPKYKTP